ncbi:ABC transporter related protein [Caldithrix abyssi DSM 13497]|uniref:ABC transporter related protein n=1 Tax=Caldithrix abyssi DSM 13497 TaxID=880073 RepID=H1XP13_CALAY|nr:ABC transporter ATP-binding protein [Caldithrix abyssi]APF20471.1 lolD lipoprotein-releasing system ATP-binding protein [Caldithrix abyssi DSM 13497]EHO41005.1 ABC transporter related protein [Caldithrix abyssi DSM 13497]
MKAIIKVENLVKIYDSGPQKVEVLKGLTFSVKPAEVVVIMGPSGVGKSTLLHIMGALDLPTSGSVWLDGQNINDLSNSALARFRNKAVGFVFQFHHLLPEFTAFENVLIPSIMHEPLTEEKEDYARYLLEEVGLSHRLQHKPNELSGGEQQRVAVARALVNKPKVLLADEPTGNLDRKNSEMLYDLMLSLNKKFNQTLVIVTHDEHMTLKASRIIELDDGKIVNEIKRN